MQQTVINILHYLINHWSQIVAYSVGGLSIAVITQFLKKKFNLDNLPIFKFLKVIKLDGPRIVGIIVTVLTAAGTAASWLIDPANAQYIPIRYAFILTAAFYVHRFFVSPTVAKIELAAAPYLAALEQVKSQNAAAPASVGVLSPSSQAVVPPVLATPLMPPVNQDPIVPTALVVPGVVGAAPGAAVSTTPGVAQS